MSFAFTSNVSATTETSFDDAVAQGVKRATQTLRHVRSAWIKEQEATVRDDRIVAYKVHMLVTFELEGPD